MKVDPGEKLKAFFKRNKPSIYKKGEVILRGDEVPYGIYFLNRGYVKNYFYSENGDEFIFIVYKKGNFFPFAWTFNQTRKPYFFEAATPCIIYKQNREDFLNFLKENPDVLLYIVGRVTARMDGLLERMEHMAFGTAYQRVCSIIYIFGERFGRRTKDGKIIIDLPLTHRDVANFLGTARETVSVEIAKLKKEGIIKNSGKHIYILSPDKLKKESLIV